MPASILTSGKWKKALLPSLSGRRKQQPTSPTRPTLAGSNTVAGLYTAVPSSRLGHDIASTLANSHVNDQVISALLDTTAYTDTDHSSRAPTQLYQDTIPRVTRSQTTGAVPSGYPSDSYPRRSNKPVISPMNLPRKPSQRDLRGAAARETGAQPTYKRSAEVCHARPLAASQNILNSGLRLVKQSSSESVLDAANRYQINSPIHRSHSNTGKISSSATTDVSGAAVDSGGSSHGALKRSRSKTMRAFAKFTGALSEHFGSRKRDASNNEDIASSRSDTSTRPLIHGIAHPKITVTPSSHHSAQSEDKNVKRARATRGGGYRAGLTAAWKRLTIVHEVDSQNGRPTTELFTDSITGLPLNEFQARLKAAQGKKEGVTDPFQAERIFDSSLDAILPSPPLGSSTPPRRRQLKLDQQVTPTKKGAASAYVQDESDLITLSPLISPLEPPAPMRNAGINNHEIKRKPVKTGSLTAPYFVPPATTSSSDTPRLGTDPKGATIRHVPRSIANLSTVDSVPERGRGSSNAVRKKKHPSPSKRQLELFGRCMEKNLATGVYQDADELGMSFDSPSFKPALLSPKDNNSKLRTSTNSHSDMRKGYDSSPSSQLALARSLGSRIPQPVRQISRSRTDSVFGRKRTGDSTLDELQEDEFPPKKRHLYTHRGPTFIH